MADFLLNLSKHYSEQLERHHNRPFLKAVMAACALVFAADGSVSFRQRIRVDQVLETLDPLKIFDPHEGVDLFNQFVEMLAQSPDQGRTQILAIIQEEVAEEPEKAALLIRVCLTVSEIDGTIPASEQTEIALLCRALGVTEDHCQFPEF